jgi:hypothetical protein
MKAYKCMVCYKFYPFKKMGWLASLGEEWRFRKTLMYFVLTHSVPSLLGSINPLRSYVWALSPSLSSWPHGENDSSLPSSTVSLNFYEV